MTTTFTNLLAKIAVPFVVVSAILLGSFSLVGQAQAATSDAVLERTLPILVSGAQLAFSAITERVNPGALVAASAASDQKLAELMALLEKLTAMYQSALKQKAELAPESLNKVSDGEVTNRPYYYIGINTPAGGESYIMGRHLIAVQYDSNVEIGKKREIYLKNVNTSTTREIVHKGLFDQAQLVRVDLAKIKFKYGPGKYKFVICAPEVTVPTGGVLCNETETFAIVPANEIPPTTQTLKVVSPNGGETFKLEGLNSIDIKYTTSAPKGEKLEVFLYHPEVGDVLSSVGIVDGSGNTKIDFPKIKGLNTIKSGNYKVTLCISAFQLPSGKDICDTSDNYFNLVSSNDIKHSMKVISPNGGETYNSEGLNSISIKYSTSVSKGEELEAYLYSSEGGNVLSNIGIVDGTGNFKIDFPKTKGLNTIKPGIYKITLCATTVLLPNDKGLCDISDNYFSISSSQMITLPPEPIPLPPSPPIELQSKSKNNETQTTKSSSSKY